MKKLSFRQQAILDYIRSHQEEKGYPPTVREIGDAVGLASSSTTHGHLGRLERKGLIRRDPSRPRAIEIVNSEQEDITTKTVPIFSSLQDTIAKDYFFLPAHIIQNDDVFMIPVNDQRMSEFGIRKGDMVIVRRGQANDGDTVLAIGGIGHIVRKLSVIEDKYVLHAEDAPGRTVVPLKGEIIGRVIGVYRNIGEVS